MREPIRDQWFLDVLAQAATQNKAALDRLADTPTPSDEGMDFELGAACDLGDTDCESCQ